MACPLCIKNYTCRFARNYNSISLLPLNCTPEVGLFYAIIVSKALFFYCKAAKAFSNYPPCWHRYIQSGK